MADTASFTKLVPGFDFLEGLVKHAGAAMPSIGQWVAPTLDPAELEKRIEELRTVQFWLEQNARMLGATIQALEVQRMTLATLKTMNVQMGDLRESLKIRLPEAGGAAFAAPASASKAAPAKKQKAADAASAAAPAGVVDPMQWWGALTKQFTELASATVREASADAAKKNLAGAMVKQPAAAAAGMPRDAVGVPVQAARKPARAKSSTSSAPTRAAPATKRTRSTRQA